MRDATRLRKPPSQTMALTIEQVEAIRKAAQAWRRDEGLSGPKPDGQLEQIIEVMLGTSAWMGEVLAIRKCDVDATRLIVPWRLGEIHIKSIECFVSCVPSRHAALI